MTTSGTRTGGTLQDRVTTTARCRTTYRGIHRTTPPIATGIFATATAGGKIVRRGRPRRIIVESPLATKKKQTGREEGTNLRSDWFRLPARLPALAPVTQVRSPLSANRPPEWSETRGRYDPLPLLRAVFATRPLGNMSSRIRPEQFRRPHREIKRLRPGRRRLERLPHQRPPPPPQTSRRSHPQGPLPQPNRPQISKALLS